MVEIFGLRVFRYERAAGQEVITGLSWDMLVLFTFISFFVFLVHFVVRDIVNPTHHTAREGEPTSSEVATTLKRKGVSEVERFTAAQRASHWIMAASIFLLMLSGFLMMNPNVTIQPLLGISWLDIHIIFSIVLIGYVVFHIGHVAYKGAWGAMLIGRREIEDLIARGKNLVGLSDEYPRQFEYPSAQKFLHLGVTTATFGVLLTGLVMTRRVAVPYLWGPVREFSFLGIHFGQGLGAPELGLVTWSFILHDLFAIMMVGLVLGHMYFALRPNEWGITRSMIVGSVTTETYAEKYAPSSWDIGAVSETDGGVAAGEDSVGDIEDGVVETDGGKTRTDE